MDGHDRGAKIVARALRDAGMEVIYTGIRQTPEMIAEAALQEDVDAVGLSSLSGAHMTLFPRVVDEVRARGLDDVVIFGGGVIPNEDHSQLKEAGIKEILDPGHRPPPSSTISGRTHGRNRTAGSAAALFRLLPGRLGSSRIP